MKDHKNLEVIGGTRDDAAGEAFDKIGRLLSLPYPAGPTISKLAEKGNPKAFTLPRPMIGSHDFDFSFSGLKTSVLYLLKNNNWDFSNSQFHPKGTRFPEAASTVNSQLLYDLCASVQYTIVDVLVRKTMKAAREYQVKSLLLGGGVGANEHLKNMFQVQCSKLNVNFFSPEKNLCTDNAGMIAAAAYFNYDPKPWQTITANPELYY